MKAPRQHSRLVFLSGSPLPFGWCAVCLWDVRCCGWVAGADSRLAGDIRGGGGEGDDVMGDLPPPPRVLASRSLPSSWLFRPLVGVRGGDGNLLEVLVLGTRYMRRIQGWGAERASGYSRSPLEAQW